MDFPRCKPLFMLLKGTNYISFISPITHDIRTLSSRIGWAATICKTWPPVILGDFIAARMNYNIWV